LVGVDDGFCWASGDRVKVGIVVSAHFADVLSGAFLNS
jgi:hypothetical protein